MVWTYLLAKADPPTNNKDISPRVLCGSLAAVLAFHFLNNFLWIQADFSFGGCDVTHHLNAQVMFWYVWEWTRGLPLSWYDKLSLLYSHRFLFNPIWSPFIHIIGCVANAVCGRGLIPVLLTSTLWFMLLIVGTCGLGCRLFGRREGLLAGVLVSLYPGLYGLSRKLGLDLPLTSMVTLGMYALVRSRGFRRPGASRVFGFCLGIALMVKFQAIIFFAAPLVLAWLRIQRQMRYYQRRGHVPVGVARLVVARRRYFIQAALLGAIIAGACWLQGIVIAVVIAFDHVRFPEKFFTPQFAGNQAVAWYYAVTARDNISVPLFWGGVPFAVGALISKFRKIGLLAVWIGVPFMVFSLIQVCWDRYIFPCFPAFALLTAWGIMRVPAREIRRFIIKSMVIIGLLQCVWFSYGEGQWRGWSHAPQDYRSQLRELVRRATVQEALPEFNCNQVMGISSLVFWGDEQVGLEYILAHAYWGKQATMTKPIAVEYETWGLPTSVEERVRFAAAGIRRQMPRFLITYTSWQGMNLRGYRERSTISLDYFGSNLRVWERDNESGK